mgnify:CR=1 FL=1
MKADRPWEEYRLMKQIRALSWLPPNTRLPRLPDDEQVLLDGLSLKENPIEWLKQTSGALIARIVLWRALKDLQEYLQGFYRARQSQHIYPKAYIQQRFGKLLDMPEIVREIFQLLDNTRPTSVSPETLETVLQMVRPYYQTEEFRGDTNSCDNKHLLLLIDLLNLPEYMDKTQWIVERHADFAAIETVRYLLSQVIPVYTSLFEPFMKVLHPHVSASTNGHQVTLGEVAIGQHGFALTLQTKVPKALFQLPKGVVLAGVRWGAAEDVCDDQGHHYLVCYPIESHKGSGRTIYMTMQLLCYPSINPVATQITLTMDKICFVGIGIQPRQKVQHHHEYVLQLSDRLVWNIDVSQIDTLQPRPWTDLIGE